VFTVAERGTSGVADLTAIAHAAYGRELRDVARLRGGSKKGVYRLTLDDGTTGTAGTECCAEASPQAPRSLL